MKTNKWVARVRGNDKDNWIRIGIIKVDEGYEIVAENKDDISTGIEPTRESAIEAVKLVWGNWETFEWLEEKEIIRSVAAALGRKGGLVKSEAKAKAAAENGKKGGRPRQVLNQNAMKEIATELIGKEITPDNIRTVCLDMGFKKAPRINIGQLIQTPECLWTTIYYSNMTQRIIVNENDIVLRVVK